MNWFTRSFIGFFVFTLSVVIAGDLPPLQMKAARLMRSEHVLSLAEMEAILGSDRAEVLDSLRKVARREVTQWADSSQLNPNIARVVLLRLPDPEVLETIGNQLAEYQYVSPYGTVSDGLFDVVLRAKQPKLLLYFARGVFRDEDADTRDFEWSDFRKMNRSMNSLYWMLRLTYELEVFSPQVRAWARVLMEHHSLPQNEKRELGRLWWKENEKAILAGDYAAVRPGISPAAGVPRPKPGSLPDPDDARRVLPQKSKGGRTPPQEDSSATDKPPSHAASSGDHATESASWMLWIWSGSAIAVILVSLWVWRRRAL